MKTKRMDVLYCGVRKKKIDNAHPRIDGRVLNIFMRYIHDRYITHINKDVLFKPQPWTKNKIISQYRFTNVRREHDRETKWLLDNIVNNEFLTFRQKIMNCILFRLYNKHETMEILGGPLLFEVAFPYSRAIVKLHEYQRIHPDYIFTTSAFMTSGMKQTINRQFESTDSVGNIIRFMAWLNKNGTFDKIKLAESQEEVYNILNSIKGIGSFLAYQMFVDFTYIEEFKFSENEFTVAGPGCKLGIDYLFKDKDNMTYEECIFWVRDNWDMLMSKVKPELRFKPKDLFIDLRHGDRFMNVMSIENCFCELSKYMKVKNNTGRPRNKYKPKED